MIEYTYDINLPSFILHQLQSYFLLLVFKLFLDQTVFSFEQLFSIDGTLIIRFNYRAT